MPIINSIVSWLMKKRFHQIELFNKYPLEVQQECFDKLIDMGQYTEWGKKYVYTDIQSIEQFKTRVPVQDYNSLKPYIDRIRRGEQKILWPTEIKWFAKSSGTTSDKSKFIPISEESLEECHFKGGKDMLTLYCSNFNDDTEIFSGKNLGLGGSHKTDQFQDYASHHGDLSAIMIQNRPFWADYLSSPDISIALMGEWEEKMDKIAQATMKENITSLAGVPSWVMVLLKHILKLSGAKNILEVWPNLEVFFHGGVNFTPYREQYEKLIGADCKYLELYNASEGFFGIQDNPLNDNLLLMLDYGIYYEFMPMDQLGQEFPLTLSLEEVETGVSYALIISTNGGLWRYLIGDTIKFTSRHPFRFKITGRTKHFINAFGEELIIENAEQALKVACERTHALVKEYTAGPVYFKEDKAGAHEWLIEFEKEPENIVYFTELLDNALKSINSDYEAKRYQDMTLRKPEIKIMKAGTFYQWMKSRGKLGGQNKVPRLANDRKYLDEILQMQSIEKIN